MIMLLAGIPLICAAGAGLGWLLAAGLMWLARI
jgi:hypothetical protein